MKMIVLSLLKKVFIGNIKKMQFHNITLIVFMFTSFDTKIVYLMQLKSSLDIRIFWNMAYSNSVIRKQQSLKSHSLYSER